MSERNNMGRKSHKVQDVQFKQNISGLPDEVGNQPTRPTVGKQQATKSSRLEQSDTK